MNTSEFLEIATSYFQEILHKGIGCQGLVFPSQWKDLENREERHFFERIAHIFRLFNESYNFAYELSNGDLSATVSRENIFAMPLKAMQANLHHLTWQTNQVADGNLNQQVFFLGDFSSAFNNLILALQEKRVVEERLQTVTDTMAEGLFLVNVEGAFVFANPEALKMLDYSFEELEGKTIHETVFIQLPDGTRILPKVNPLWLAIENGEKQNKKDAVFTCKSGMMIPVSYSCRPISHKGSLGGAVISFQDISIQKKYLHSLKTVNKLLEKQASTDTLTGIANRLEFDRELEVERKKAKRYAAPLSLILFDIDHFKLVNDTYGHSAGDEVLKNLAQLVSASLRETDLFARWGGEEFVVLCPNTDLPSSLIVAEKLRKIIEQFDFQKPKKVTASFGVSLLGKKETSTTFINKADAALYRAKENGRNQVQAEKDDTQ